MLDINNNEIEVKIGDIYEVKWKKGIFVIRVDRKWSQSVIGYVLLTNNQTDYKIGEQFMIDDGEIIRKL